MENKGQYISTTEAAKRLHVTGRRVTGLCNEGKLEGAVRNGRNWKIPTQALQNYMLREGISPYEVEHEQEAELLPCAVGNTSYIEISSECYYVDKTLLIRELIDDHNMVTLFIRPRRFGKTLAINMLKTFFEKTEADTSRYFTGKKIWQCGEKYRSQQGAYPVITLTFKDVKFQNWAESIEAIRLVMKDEYKRHSELKQSAALEPDAKDYMARLEKGELSDVELSRA